MFSAEWSAATRWIARLRIIRAFYQLRFRSHLRIANDGSGFVRDLIAQRVEKLLLASWGCHAQHARACGPSPPQRRKGLFASLDLTLHGRKLMLASIEGLDPTIKGLFALSNAAFSHAHFAHTLLCSPRRSPACSAKPDLCLDVSFASHGFSLLFRVCHQSLSLLSCVLGKRSRFNSSFLRRRLGNETSDDENREQDLRQLR